MLQLCNLHQAHEADWLLRIFVKTCQEKGAHSFNRSFWDITLHSIKHGLINNFLQGAHGGVSLHGWVEAQNNSMLSCQIFSQAQVVGSQVFAFYGQCVAIILLPTYQYIICQYIYQYISCSNCLPSNSRDNRIIHLPPALAYHPCLEVPCILCIWKRNTKCVYYVICIQNSRTSFNMNFRFSFWRTTCYLNSHLFLGLCLSWRPSHSGFLR